MKTKKTIVNFVSKVIFLSFLTLFFVKCDDFSSDTEGELIADNIFNTKTAVETAILGVYSPLADKLFASSEAYTHLWAADDRTAVTGSNKSEFLEYDQLTPLNTNAKMDRTWALLWKIVGAANTVIDATEEIQEVFRREGDEAGSARALGEVHYLRALAYYELVRGWGEIPLITTQIGVTGKESLASFQDIYSLIIADLIFAKENLGSNAVNGVYRATKWQAQSLLANVYLTTAGFPLKNTGNYALAAAEAKEVINVGIYSLEAEFSGVMGITDNNLGKDGNTEAIISFPANNRLDGWDAGNFQAEAIAFGDKTVEFAFFDNYPEGKRKEFTFDGGDDGARPKYSVEKYGAPFGPAPKDFDILYMRYAELLLIYAEAQIQATSDNTDQSALDALNLVRVRAGLDPVTTATAAEVVWERAWEIAGDFSRWHDIVRTEILDEVNALRDTRDNDLTPLGSALTEQNPWALIPANDLAANPNLAK